MFARIWCWSLSKMKFRNWSRCVECIRICFGKWNERTFFAINLPIFWPTNILSKSIKFSSRHLWRLSRMPLSHLTPIDLQLVKFLIAFVGFKLHIVLYDPVNYVTQTVSMIINKPKIFVRSGIAHKIESFV